uniref:WASH complex subunit 3 n=1 Tax=Mola mola TaxID=94237 RepID=A0A3Q4ACX5_MOLML
MDEDGLPIVGSGVDLTQVPAIQQRRIVAYLNQFVKLANISLRIQQIETTLCILEAKLSSIPGLEDVTIEGVSQRQPAQTNGPTAAHPSQTDRPAVQNDTFDILCYSEAAAENVMTVAKDPCYARYLKMVQVGVPVMAIRNKMVLEGLDPNLLDTPDAPMPNGGTRGTEDQDVAATSSDSESSFSD